MGSVNTWRTFEHGLAYFRYFAPASGSISADGEGLAKMVYEQGYGSNDFFIFAASGTADFAYRAFKGQIVAMSEASDGTFVPTDKEKGGNLAFRERVGYAHDSNAANEYMYNALQFFWH